ncbi:nitrile hydratase subunit alpha [Streptomyces sp. NPDC006668]|uniref:nitrile hydratase subunit alpha n=1 Tax=Streptomyces sp. NPDC006668 TaxID=3156903 RepID=UPI00340B6C2F
MSGDHVDVPVAARVRRLEARLVAAGLVTDEQLDGILEQHLYRATPFNGARTVARAWVDDAFRELLLTDANAALEQLGLGGLLAPDEHLSVVANTAEVHNVIVCTLCSCYPLLLLGPSPSWYRSDAYRSRVVRDPHGVLEEFGFHVPPGTAVRVWDATAEARYMVLPRRPEATGHLDEEGLRALVTRSGLLGTAGV